MDSEIEPGKAILQRIVTLEVQRAQIEAQVALEMLELDDLRKEQADAAPGDERRQLLRERVADELSLALRNAPGSVQARLAGIRRVRERMPITWASHQAGQIDAYRVSKIAAATAKLTRPDSDCGLDERAADYGANHTPSQLKGWLDRAVARLEPDAANARGQHEYARRAVWVRPKGDGMSTLTAYIRTTDAKRIEAMVTAAAKNKRGDGRSFEQRRADAFVDQFLGQPAGSGSSGRAVIGVIVPIGTLAGLSNAPGESVDGQFALPGDMIRDLANEPGTLFYRIIKDPLGNILDITEIGYRPSSELRHAVELRDGTCGFATCDRPAMDCDLDHIKRWPRGPTSGINLDPLCRRHHVMKTLLESYFIACLSMFGFLHRPD